MKRPPLKKINFTVAFLALSVVLFQLIRVYTEGLSRWKGGGFGMYTEVHYKQHEIWVNHANFSLDSLAKNNSKVRESIVKLKRTPSDKNLHQTAQLIQKFAQIDTLTIQVWKPKIAIENAEYTRELINELKYIH